MQLHLDANQPDGYAQLNGGAIAGLNGKAKTATVINHANAIINGYLGESYPDSATELADQIQALVAAMTDEGVSSPGRYRQLYYPAIYACYLYQPAVAKGETLHEAYRKKNWFLPSCGQLARIYNFFYNSCGRVTYGDGGRILVANANENPGSEALLPLFANLRKRIEDAGVQSSPFTMPSDSTYWSVTEYNSTLAWLVYFGSGSVSTHYGIGKCYGSVARAVTAFTFTL